MKHLFLIVALFVSGCAVSEPEPSNTPSIFWTCQHIYSPNTLSVSFEAENIRIVNIRECPQILLNNRACPSYVKIIDVTGQTVWLTENEWENYSCTFQEIKENETR